MYVGVLLLHKLKRFVCFCFVFSFVVMLYPCCYIGEVHNVLVFCLFNCSALRSHFVTSGTSAVVSSRLH